MRRAGTWRDRIETRTKHGWQLLAHSSFHVRIIPAAGAPRRYFFQQVEIAALGKARAKISASCVMDGIGTFTAAYVVNASGVIDISVKFSPAGRKKMRAGLEFLRFKRPQGYNRLRLYDFLPSGWSNDDNEGIVFSSRWQKDSPAEQMSLSPLDTGDKNIIDNKDQGMGLRYPPGWYEGETTLVPGREIVGNIKIYISRQDLFGCDIKTAPGTLYRIPATIAAPRYSYRQFIKNWCKFISRRELWVPLGSGMGLFHRGYYNVLRGKKEMKVSGILRCERKPDGSLHGWTENERILEIAWGGGCNVVLAETMARLGRQGFLPDGEKKAAAMVKAILHFRDGGFQVRTGPCRGAWWNEYVVESQRFCSRYGRDHVETPNQGIINYFLYRLFKMGVTGDPALAKRIEHNCLAYLSAMERPDGGVEFARYTDGRTGEDRHYVKYKTCFASGCALAALSWLCAWRLTGNQAYRKKAARLFDHVAHDHLARNDWRFLEYDTCGADAVAPSWILTAFCEALRDFDRPAWRKAADHTFRLLQTFIYPFEPKLDRYLAKESVWGGTMNIRGGIIHGSSPNSRQGIHSAHIRFDFPLAFKHYYDLTGRKDAYAALAGYLNFMTWHQFLKRGLPIGFGSTSEHCTLRAHYIQDTVQVKHSNPLLMLMMLDKQPIMV